MSNTREPIGIPVGEFISNGKQENAIRNVLQAANILAAHAKEARDLGVPLKFKALSGGAEFFIDSLEVHLDPNGVTEETK